MKKIFRRFWLIPLFLLLAGFEGGSPAFAAAFSIAPSAISNQYSGMVTLTITGLTNGETVAIEKYLDANTNGLIDGADWLLQSFRLTDGQVSTIGGVTNVNIPGDSNGAGGSITTRLNFGGTTEIDHLVGAYLFKLSSPSGRFAAITNMFNITNSAYAQSFTGQVRSNGTATAVANAVVVLLDANGFLAGGAVANNSGNYTIKAAPGTYQLLAMKSNYVANGTVPQVALSAGATVTTNLTAIAATRNISGRVADAANTNTALPGIMMILQSADGMFAVSLTGTNGNFKAPVTAGTWQLEAQTPDLALHGYLDLRSSSAPVLDTSTGSVSGVNFLVPKGTAMFYGSIKDDFGNPLAGFSFWGSDQDGQYYLASASDANGNYCVLALAETWDVGLDDDEPRLASYAYSGSIPTTTLTNGQVYRADFVFKLGTNHISGNLRDDLNNSISGVRVRANASINGTNFQSGPIETDANGNYTLNVPNGSWTVSVDCGCMDCSGALHGRGYQCVGWQQITISGNNGVANFIAESSLQVTNTSLPDGVINVSYNSQVQASGGLQPYSWSLSPGSTPFPPGLDISIDGNISGTPAAGGTFLFNVRVTDARAATADALLSIYIPTQPLQITTASLSDGQQGMPYSQQLQASGGQPAYSWSLTPGSAPLPPGLGISSDGVISGTPTSNGTFFFNVRVADAQSATVDSLFSIYIPTPALQITTLSLPNAQQGLPYTQQLQVVGGQMPYRWTLAPGSLSLPPNLSLSTNGVLSGTLATNGTFFFIVRVTDASSIYVNRSLGLTSNPKPTLTLLNRNGNQVQLRLTGATGQNYTVQFCTNLVSANWFSLLVTNPSAPSVTLSDAAATNRARFYRAWVGP